jgi:hypothetical protein
MKKIFLILFFISCLSFYYNSASAQCSICSKTVQQMGKKPAEGFNSGIIYLMLLPYGVIGVIGYKWWKSNREV